MGRAVVIWRGKVNTDEVNRLREAMAERIVRYILTRIRLLFNVVGT